MTENKEITIGGSEISVVMGLNRWKTPLRLWAEKTAKIITQDISDREYIQLGNELEDFVAKRFSKLSGKKVRRDSKTFKYKKYPYMMGHIDRRVVGTDELLECKTCNAWKAHEWEGEEIPQEYILQVMWYLGVTGMSKGYIAVLIGGNKFVWKEITFDNELFEQMVEAAKNFVEYHIKEDVAPIAISGDSSTLSRLYLEQTEAIIESKDSDVNTLIDEIQALKRVIDNAETEKEGKEAKLKQIIGSAEGIQTPTYKVTWQNQNSTKLDYEKLKADKLYDKYAVVKSIRVLRVNKRKEKNNG